MKAMHSDVSNTMGVILCLATAMMGVLAVDYIPEAYQGRVPEVSPTKQKHTVVIDARSHAVPVREYQRIVSINPVADHILLELVEPYRLLGVTSSTLDDHPNGWRFGDKMSIGLTEMLAPILSLSPDLVVVSAFADQALVSRLKEQAIEVFDLGGMRGLQDTQKHIEVLAQLLDVPARGERLIREMKDYLVALEIGLKDKHRVRGIYLSVIGDSYFGGTDKTSYGDILRYGGIVDLAKEHGYSGWPRYSIEQIIMMNPDLIVTPMGGAQLVCRHEELRSLSACISKRIVELPRGLSDDAGLGVLEAARLLQQLVYSGDYNNSKRP